MLIKVFGIWLMATNILYLQQADLKPTGDDSECLIALNGYRIMPIHTGMKSCDEVAAEINRQIKLAEGGK